MSGKRFGLAMGEASVVCLLVAVRVWPLLILACVVQAEVYSNHPRTGHLAEPCSDWLRNWVMFMSRLCGTRFCQQRPTREVFFRFYDSNITLKSLTKVAIVHLNVLTILCMKGNNVDNVNMEISGTAVCKCTHLRCSYRHFHYCIPQYTTTWHIWP